MRLIFTQDARSDLRRLDVQVRRRVLRKIVSLFSHGDPLRFARRLRDPRAGTHRFRIGDYRVIIDARSDRAVVLRVAHRKDAYRW